MRQRSILCLGRLKQLRPMNQDKMYMAELSAGNCAYLLANVYLDTCAVAGDCMQHYFIRTAPLTELDNTHP